MVQYDPFSNEIIHGDPYPIYKQLRDEAPAYFVERNFLGDFEVKTSIGHWMRFLSTAGLWANHGYNAKLSQPIGIWQDEAQRA